MSFQKVLRSILILPFCFLMSVVALAQNRTVTGKVLDSKDGSGIPGASVLIKGTRTGTNTNAEGAFSINVPTTSSTLVISAVGFAEQQVAIGDGPVNVTMEASGSNLNEVVVVGYGTARRKDLTGSVSTVAAKDFNKGTYTSPDQLIQGKAAGVLVINNTGQPGGSTTIRIRGSSSIRSGNQPLFVLDGVPLSRWFCTSRRTGGTFGNDGGNPLNYMNPNDIASIEILKDASATAIYGSRGANGVVLITTKRGKSGVPTLTPVLPLVLSNVLKKLEVLNADEYRAALKEYSITSGDFGASVDAFDAITRTALLKIII